MKLIINNILLTFAITAGCLALAPVQNAGAVDVLKDVCNKAALTGDYPAACKDSNPRGNNPIFGPDGILTKIINIISLLVGIAAVIMIIIGGLKFITSGSNPQEVTGARETVLYALVGLVVAISSQLIVRFILSKL